MATPSFAGLRRVGGSIGRWLLRLLLLSVVFSLAGPPRYTFPEPKPFAGDAWYNPYADFSPTGLRRCNTHTHSHCWGGLTTGVVQASEVARFYGELGYDLAPITNYQSITDRFPTQELYVTGYEHALGMAQLHHSVIGAHAVCWFDYPYWQGLAQKQHVLDILGADAPILLINHPDKGQGYTPYEMARLSGYTGIEIATKYSTDATRYWDAALSAGRPVWGFASDDGRRQNQKEGHIAIGWFLVHGVPRQEDAILDAIRHGHFHAVWNPDQGKPAQLLSSSIEDGQVLTVRVAEPAERIRFIGQGGAVLREEHGVSSAQYALRPEDTYVRVEVHAGKAILLLNPVFRYVAGGDPMAASVPGIDLTATMLWRGGGVVVFVLGAWRIRPRRRPAPAAAAAAAAASAA